MEGLIRSHYILLENSSQNKWLENTKGPFGKFHSLYFSEIENFLLKVL